MRKAKGRWGHAGKQCCRELIASLRQGGRAAQERQCWDRRAAELPMQGGCREPAHCVGTLHIQHSSLVVGSPGWQLLIHNTAPTPLLGSDEAHSSSSSRVVVVPGLPGKPNTCPQEAASQQRLQKAPVPHGPSTQQHGQPGPAPHGKSLCASALPYSLKEGFNAWLAVKACPPSSDDSHSSNFVCFHPSYAREARLDGRCSRSPLEMVLGSKRKEGKGLQAAWLSATAPRQQLAHLCPEAASQRNRV